MLRRLFTRNTADLESDRIADAYYAAKDDGATAEELADLDAAHAAATDAEAEAAYLRGRLASPFTLPATRNAYRARLAELEPDAD
jgi:hypothetical protein